MSTSPPYVTHFEAKNFGCLRDVKLDLTRLHAFIGPNDSGKSTILQGIRCVMNVMSVTAGNPTDRSDRDGRLTSGVELSVRTSDDLICRISKGRDQTSYNREISNAAFAEPFAQDNTDRLFEPVAPFPGPSGSAGWRALLLHEARVARLDPDEMRKPGAIVPDEGKLSFYGDRGHGLAAIYDGILGRGDDSFRTIVAEVRKLFPSVKNLRLSVPDQGQKAFSLELVDGTKVPAQDMSEGLLYYLGFAAIPYLDLTSALLVEEPENGLHPARITEIVRILRKVSETTQVLVATHSPLVINELEADEVTVVTRDPGTGTQTKRLKDTPNFEERSKVYALGELWLSYADGETEAPLLSKSVG